MGSNSPKNIRFICMLDRSPYSLSKCTGSDPNFCMNCIKIAYFWPESYFSTYYIIFCFLFCNLIPNINSIKVKPSGIFMVRSTPYITGSHVNVVGSFWPRDNYFSIIHISRKQSSIPPPMQNIIRLNISNFVMNPIYESFAWIQLL